MPCMRGVRAWWYAAPSNQRKQNRLPKKQKKELDLNTVKTLVYCAVLFGGLISSFYFQIVSNTLFIDLSSTWFNLVSFVT